MSGENTSIITQTILSNIRKNASILSEIDLIKHLSEYSLYHVISQILENLDHLDLQSCLLVSKEWNSVINECLNHSENSNMSANWKLGTPEIRSVQCLKQRAVCTISEMAVDETYLLVGLGTSGNVELWNRRNPTYQRIWINQSAHEEGVYAVDMNSEICVSGGEDGAVKIWNKLSGDLIKSLDHHTYIGPHLEDIVVIL